MSLINQMLQELDARGNQSTLGGMLQGQVRAVPQRRGPHPALWIVVILACLVGAAGLWTWLGRATLLPVPQEASTTPAPALAGFSLKIASGLEKPQTPAPVVPVAAPVPTDQAEVMPASVPGHVVTPSAAVAAAPTVPVTSPAPAPAPIQPVANNISSASVALAKSATPGNDGQQKAFHPVSPATEPVPVSPKEVQSAKAITLPAAVQSGVPGADSALIAKQVKELTPRQLAENEYRKASGLIQQERTADAISALERALQLDARHAEARQTLAALLIQSRRQDEAMRTLREGLQNDASQSGLAMILARLQLDRGDLKPAIDTLQRSLPHAGERADYLAFLAALLQRDGRHREAIDNYAQALRKSPGNAVWWMGQGISLQAENRIPEAIEAYKRAKTANGLSVELRAFVDDRLNSL